MKFLKPHRSPACNRSHQQFWFHSELGKEVLAAEKRAIESQLYDIPFDKIKGDQSFQSANCYNALIDFGNQHPFFKLVPSQIITKKTDLIIADGTELPLVPDNANLMILHHHCDFSDHPQQVIREAVLSLAPEGKLIVIGFNPSSLWGLWRLIAIWFKPMPWRANFIRPQRMTDWLTLLNCRIEQKEFVVFKPAVRQRGLSSKFGFIGALATRYNLPFGAVYVITATKKTHARTPIRNRWKRPELKPLMMPKPSYNHIDRDPHRNTEQKP
ncbi:MAG: hypothetical protein KUG72_02730 [Pseudomonadales bacterium]|nr:hypothetical protein [Pseudomonadales bacterium]